jgi:large subunit ribosomal protein L10
MRLRRNMHENRTTYPKKKSQMYQQLQELPKKYKVVAVIKMNKVRSTQILPLRKTLKGEVEIISIKDKVAKLALETLDIPGIKEIAKELTGQCMFMFTNMSPFKLNVLLAKNKIMMGARGGDIASIDIVVPAKNTGIAPGPMLTEFKEAGIPTKIDQGTIWISKDSTPVQKGGVINEKLASLLGKLDIKPVEAGISLFAALEEGTTYAAEEMVIDVEKIRSQFSQAHQEAVSLSIEAAYITADNISQILSKASQYARSLSIESGFMTDETKEQILQKADAQARAVAGQAKNYTPA